MNNNIIELPSFYYRDYEIPGFRYFFQQQRQTNWCWIATAVSVANFYNNNVNTWTQCQVYNMCVSLQTRMGNDACQYGIRTLNSPPSPNDPSVLCNLTGNPEVSMDHVGIFYNKGPFSNYGTGAVINLVDGNHPPIIGLNFTGPNGNWKHVVVVFGYTADGKWLIADPLKEQVQIYSPDDLQSMGIYTAELFVSTWG